MGCERVSDCNGCTCHINPPCSHCMEDHENVDNHPECPECSAVLHEVGEELFDLKAKLSQDTCNRGHKSLPITLWNCPVCTESTASQKRVAVRTLEMISKIKIDASDKIMLIKDLETAVKWAKQSIKDIKAMEEANETDQTRSEESQGKDGLQQENSK